MIESILASTEWHFFTNLGASLLCGAIIGFERENKNKPAGISTQSLVIGGAMTFAFLSTAVGGGDPARIAAQIVSGVGFLGAGIILKSESKGKVTNLTTAASIWYAAGIGMAIGFEYYLIAIMATLYAVIIARIPHSKKYIDD